MPAVAGNRLSVEGGRASRRIGRIDRVVERAETGVGVEACERNYVLARGHVAVARIGTRHIEKDGFSSIELKRSAERIPIRTVGVAAGGRSAECRARLNVSV